MKKLLLLSLCPLLMMSFSCHNQHGSNKTVNLCVRTIDEKGNNLANFKANCYLHDIGTVLFDATKTPLVKRVDTTSKFWVIIHVQGIGVSEEKVLYNGINRDTTIIFVIKRCK